MGGCPVERAGPKVGNRGAPVPRVLCPLGRCCRRAAERGVVDAAPVTPLQWVNAHTAMGISSQASLVLFCPRKYTMLLQVLEVEKEAFHRPPDGLTDAEA
jgi:hypothetical protein